MLGFVGRFDRDMMVPEGWLVLMLPLITVVLLVVFLFAMSNVTVSEVDGLGGTEAGPLC